MRKKKKGNLQQKEEESWREEAEDNQILNINFKNNTPMLFFCCV